MPYNPNDPNSDPHNPEGAAAPSTGLETNTEEKVRICFPQVSTRGQSIEAHDTVEKMAKIWQDLRDGKITQEAANTNLDGLTGDVATHITDPVTLELVNQAIASIKNPTPPLP